jgi:hypothetical protein
MYFNFSQLRLGDRKGLLSFFSFVEPKKGWRYVR